jgi:hypothetical protein
MGYTVIFYLDNFATNVNKPAILDLSYSITAGIRLSLQNPNTYPEIMQARLAVVLVL